MKPPVLNARYKNVEVWPEQFPFDFSRLNF